MHRAVIAAALFSLSAALAAPGEVCVRNYHDNGSLVCHQFPQVYALVVPGEHVDKEVCARIYADFYCDTTKEYVKVQALNGNEICVLNDDQPGVSNFCVSVPQYYNYIKRQP